MKLSIGRILIRTGAAALVLAVAAGVAVESGDLLAAHRMHRRVAVPGPTGWAIPADAAAIARGQYLFRSRGCAECHGENAAGREFIHDGKGLRIAAPNLTAGAGSAVAGYRAEDWERTIRHGVKPSGQPLMVMPSEDYNRLTDDDAGSIVAYVGQLPPVAGSAAVIELPLPVRVLYGFGLIKDAAAKIDHQLPPTLAMRPGTGIDYGRYVAYACIGCHGPGFSGGAIPGAPPDWPAAANLTPAPDGVLGRYPDAGDLARMFRSGKRADGTAVSTVMPFGALGTISDDDVTALYAFLRTVPPRRSGQR